tara:strand:+ start:1863 stop:2834 length:972 start_codon:yes stop_codon:yes gene_type:complete
MSIVENAQSSMLTRKEAKPHLKRKDWPGLLYLSVHLSLVGGTGYLVSLSTNTTWIVPAILLHGFILSTLFHPLHECIHGTAFRTRWLNETVMQILGFIYIWPGLLFRYDHAPHHSYTQIKGKDTEMAIPTPRNLGDYLVYVSGLTHHWRNLGWLFRHSMGRMLPEDRAYVPETEVHKIFLEARIMLAGYVLIMAGGIVSGYWWVPVIYYFLPRFLGEPVVRFFRVAEHVGMEETPNEHSIDMTRNTRTTLTNPLVQFLTWNMGFHGEHHVFPGAPFHQLPALHERIGHNLYVAKGGYLWVHWNIIQNHLEGFSLQPARKIEAL